MFAAIEVIGATVVATSSLPSSAAGLEESDEQAVRVSAAVAATARVAMGQGWRDIPRR
jgi:hypothetical protein